MIKIIIVNKNLSYNSSFIYCYKNFYKVYIKKKNYSFKKYFVWLILQVIFVKWFMFIKEYDKIMNI